MDEASVSRARQRYTPFPDSRLLSRVEVLDELSRKCARYRNPADWDERMNMRIMQVIERIDAFSRDGLQLVPGLPLNWQRLATYLHTKGISRTGTFEFLPTANSFPKRYHVAVQAPSLEERSDGYKVGVVGQGMSEDAETTISKAVGELLERYFLAVYRSKDFVVATADEIVKSKRGLNIERLPSFLPWQMGAFPDFVRSGDVPLHWQWGTEVLSGKKALIPSQLVHWTYNSVPHGARRVTLLETNTNGAAGGFTYNETLVSAILELIQRDGFLMYWLNSIAPKIIPLRLLNADGAASKAYKELQEYGIECYLLDTTTDIGIFSCICVLIDKRGEPLIAVGGGAGFDVDEALTQSINEALSVLTYLHDAKPYVLPTPYVPFQTPINRWERLRMWRGEEMLRRFTFFISGEEVSREQMASYAIPRFEAQSQLDDIIKRFRQKGEGYEIYAYSVQHPVLDELGYHVLQAVVPALMPLYLSETNAPLDSKRLAAFSQKKGGSLKTNELPHPFP